MDPICIYHHNCADGFAAAYAVRAALGDIEFVGGTHGSKPPDVTDRDVIVVDFSYKRPVLERMARDARSILILDHHKSAAEDLAGLLRPEGDWYDQVEQAGDPNPQLNWEDPMPGHVRAVFDMDRSGAGIAWDFFHDAPRPPLIDHIEDRDLWRFALPATREIQAAVFAREYDFAEWDVLMSTPLLDLYDDGEAIERKHHKDVRELIANAQRRMVIGGHDVPVLNAPYFHSSDAGHLMAKGEPFAACYWDTPGGRTFSLRSRPGAVDVSEIATQYGGGGHQHAAGFRMPGGWEGDGAETLGPCTYCSRPVVNGEHSRFVQHMECEIAAQAETTAFTEERTFPGVMESAEHLLTLAVALTRAVDQRYPEIADEAWRELPDEVAATTEEADE